MSSGPTLTGETCMEVVKKGRINIELTKKDWCTYEGICRYDRMVSRDCICWQSWWLWKCD